MNIEDIEFIDQNNVCLYYEIDNIEFHLNFIWEFETYNEEEGEATIYVYADDCEQYINGVRHPYFPSKEEIYEVKLAIEDIVLQDLIYYGIDKWLESRELDEDYFNEN
jgi:hypothetical protein